MSDVTARITELYLYPIKSCAGIRVNEALLTPTGLQYDRHFMLIDENGVMQSQRDHARMALIVPSIDGDRIHIDAPEMPRLSSGLNADGAARAVQIWDDVVSGLDMGDDAAAWFSEALDQRVRLVRFNAAVARPCSKKWTGDDHASTEFADGYPLLLIGTASMAELNRRLTESNQTTVDVRRFRPNIVMDGIEAHDEDLLEWLNVDQQIQLKNVKPCTRCPIPDIDPNTALSQPSVTDALLHYRRNARMDDALTFGMNAIIRQGSGQSIRVGMTIAADYVF